MRQKRFCWDVKARPRDQSGNFRTPTRSGLIAKSPGIYTGLRNPNGVYRDPSRRAFVVSWAYSGAE